jgi:uncharacterized C2H2 Zn-finger protein
MKIKCFRCKRVFKYLHNYQLHLIQVHGIPLNVAKNCDGNEEKYLNIEEGIR